MKTYIKLTIIVFCTIFVASCSFFEEKSSTSNADAKVVKEFPDSIKQRIIKQDSLSRELIAKIDTLTREVNKNKNSIAEIQKSVDNLKSPRSLWNYLTLGGLFLAVIAIILNAIKHKGLSRADAKKLFSDFLDRYNIKTRIESLERANNSNSNSRYMQPGKGGNSNIESRISDLEGKIKEVINAPNPLLQAASNTSTTGNTGNANKPSGFKEPTANKSGYAKINSDKFFTEILDSKQETCVYSIKFLSEKKGEFDIISLDKIKSRNGWQDVIDFQGNCTMDEAKDYTLEEHGVCEKIDASTWEVTTKLKIKIHK